MTYLVTFLEGLISFISPCMLPMLPIYLTYFAGDANKERNTFINSIAFVIGFTLVFCILGVFAGTVGGLLKDHQTIVNIVCGTIVILFGLNYLEVIKIKLFNRQNKNDKEVTGFFSAFLFGVIFSINLTPCVGAFLGSALMMASVSGTMLKGTLLLLVYSLGLGVPIVISALLIKKLTSVFDFIKQHYKIINNISGIFLIIIGISIIFGFMNNLLHLPESINNSDKDKDYSVSEKGESMKEINLTNENFEEELKNNEVILVDFWATWCGPCRMLAPTLSEIAEEYKDKIKVGKVNVDEETELASKYRITSIPTLILFKNGQIVNKVVGLMSKSELERMINKAL